MYVFDDSTCFVKVLALDVPWAHSYADMRKGKTDRERRENYRLAATGKLQPIPPAVHWWAFRITVGRAGRPLDVDNIAKTIIDAFCAQQISRDGSAFEHLGLYPDDTFDHVRVLQVMGNRSSTSDTTRIEIFACTQEPAGES